MGLFDKLKKSKDKKEVKIEKKEDVKPKTTDVEENKADKTKPEPKQEKKLSEDKTQIKSAKDKKLSEKKAKKIKYQSAYKVLLRPVVSEKATYLTGQNSYVFEVAPNMNKIEVKKAIISVYGVEPIKVNIMNVSGKFVRYGKVSGKTKAWKKAIVTLKPGETIKIYEGV